MNDKLKDIVERIERLEEEKRERAADVNEVYKEAKNEGYDPKILRKVVALRRKSKDDRAQEEAELEAYLTQLGEVI